MTLKQRRFLYSLFILLFVALTPALWLYAAGYKFGQGLRLEKTGILIINSEPKQADIYLDGKKPGGGLGGLFAWNNKPSRTPAKIKNLRPGEYSVRLESPGYWPWGKKLEVRPGESTFAEDIVLFRDESPLYLLAGDFSIIPAPGTDLALAAGREKIAVIDIKKSQLAYEGSGTTSSAYWQWSPDKKHFTNGRYVWETSRPETGFALPAVFHGADRPLAWTGNKKIFGLSGRDIAAYSPAENKLEIFSQNGQLDGLRTGANGLYALKKNGNASTLSIIDQDSGAASQNISLPLSDYVFLDESPFLIDVYDRRHGILYLIDPFPGYKPLVKIIPGAEKTAWISRDQFAYTDGHEIWLADLASGQDILIARYSQKINDLFWHPSLNYVIFSTEAYIATIELDKREKYNFTRLISGERISGAALSRNGSRLLFSGTIDGQTGVYQLILQ